MVATTRIVRIGNSRGIRIPKTLLEQADPPEQVELHAAGDDRLLDPPRSNVARSDRAFPGFESTTSIPWRTDVAAPPQGRSLSLFKALGGMTSETGWADSRGSQLDGSFLTTRLPWLLLASSNVEYSVAHGISEEVEGD